MNIYCTQGFKFAFEKLLKKKAHRSIEAEIIEYFFNKEANQLLSGVRLNNSSAEPYIKKRLEGSGGFRLYFLIIIKNDSLYLMFVHPKTGPGGAENIDDNYKAKIYKDVLEDIKNHNLYKLTVSEKQRNIKFNHLSNI